ncbi:MAG: IS3 family transposase [bacterium]|nr:IS3 family transposase [bacterium]
MMRLMDEHYMEHPSYGVLRMQDHLLSRGFIVNEKRVRRLLRLMGLMAIYPRINLSKLGQAKYIRTYLLRGLIIIRINQVWAIDITYIPIAKSCVFLFPVYTSLSNRK